MYDLAVIIHCDPANDMAHGDAVMDELVAGGRSVGEPTSVMLLPDPLKSCHGEHVAAFRYKIILDVTPAPGQYDPAGHKQQSGEPASE